MDQQLKARLIGAIVLVLLAVALVPELLSGRKPTVENAANSSRGTRTYTIDLGGAVAGSARLPSPPPAGAKPATSLPGVVTAPGPTADAAAADPAAEEAPEPEPTPTQSPAPVAATPPPTGAAEAEMPAEAATKPTAVPAKGGWSVQVGAFGSDATARKLVAELKRDGFTAYVAPLNRSGKILHRVRVGPEPNRADADKLAVRLKGRGLPASVVATDG